MLTIDKTLAERRHLLRRYARGACASAIVLTVFTGCSAKNDLQSKTQQEQHKAFQGSVPSPDQIAAIRDKAIAGRQEAVQQYAAKPTR